MTRTEQLRAAIANYAVSNHPFYQTWRMGTLPVAKLQTYAHEYARFIETIPLGWDRIGETAIAAEEREHHSMWLDFTGAVDSVAGPASGPEVGQVSGLVERSVGFSQQVPEALGSLYAFEFQQPTTSETKLDGLREHYGIGEVGEEYFKVHAGDFSEPDLLEKRIDGLSDTEFDRALAACSATASGMWVALDGILAA